MRIFIFNLIQIHFVILKSTDTELPKATQTSAMSGAGVLRLFNRVGETVNKMTYKMEESDQVIIPSSFINLIYN